MSQRAPTTFAWIAALLACLVWSGLHCAPTPLTEPTNETTQDSGQTDTAPQDQSPPQDQPPQDQSTPTETGPEPSTEPGSDTPAEPASDAGIEPTPDATTNETTPEPGSEAIPEPAPEVTPEPQPEPQPQAPRQLFVGQTSAVTSYQLDVATGTLSKKQQTSVPGALRFLAFHPNKKFAYAANLTNVFTFTIAPGQRPRLIDTRTSGESGTHLDVDPSGKYVFVASYGGNQVSMLPLGTDGKPKAPTFQRGGKNNTNFCVKAHQVRVHPSNRFVYVPCLGSDHILVLAFDPATGKVTPKPVAKTPQGAGPRHLDFHPSLDVLYVVNELKSSVIAFKINTTTGALTRLQEISTLPAGTTQPSKSSDIHVSPDGKMVFAVNREPLNNIAQFSVASDGKLTRVGHVKTGGVHARTFAFGPNGQFIYVGNTKSKSVTVIKRQANGTWSLQKTHTFPSEVWFVGLLPQ